MSAACVGEDSRAWKAEEEVEPLVWATSSADPDEVVLSMDDGEGPVLVTDSGEVVLSVVGAVPAPITGSRWIAPPAFGASLVPGE